MIAQERIPVMSRSEVIRLLKSGGYDLCGLRAQVRDDVTHLISSGQVIIGGLGPTGIVMPEMGMHVSLLPLVVDLAKYAYKNGMPYVLNSRESAVAELERAGNDELARTLEGL